MPASFGYWCCWVGASGHDLALQKQQKKLFAFLDLVTQQLFTVELYCVVRSVGPGMCLEDLLGWLPFLDYSPSGHFISPFPKQLQPQCVQIRVVQILGQALTVTLYEVYWPLGCVLQGHLLGILVSHYLFLCIPSCPLWFLTPFSGCSSKRRVPAAHCAKLTASSQPV